MTLDLRAVRERTGMLKAVAEGNPVVRATVADLEGLDTHCRALRIELERCAHPLSGDLSLIAAAANDGLVCEPTLGIDNMRRQLLAIREVGRAGTVRAAAVFAQAQDGPA